MSTVGSTKATRDFKDAKFTLAEVVSSLHGGRASLTNGDLRTLKIDLGAGMTAHFDLRRGKPVLVIDEWNHLTGDIATRVARLRLGKFKGRLK